MQEPCSDELDGRVGSRVGTLCRGHVSSKRCVNSASIIVFGVISCGVCSAVVGDVGEGGVWRKGDGVKIDTLQNDAIECEGDEVEEGA